MLPTASDLQQQIDTECQRFTAVVCLLSEQELHLRLADKWSVADVMQHLYLSALPVVRLMSGPREVLRQWDDACIISHTAKQIRVNYQSVLATGVKAPAAFTPRPEDYALPKEELITQFASAYQTLVAVITTWSEEELDTYCMPHPALGKLSVRDMLSFTYIHTQHHLQLLPLHCAEAYAG